MTRRHLARADAVAHTPAEDLTPCPGRCNAAYRRAQADYEDAYWRWADTIDEDGHTDDPEPPHHGIEFWPGRPVWCEPTYAPVVGPRGQVTMDRVRDGCQGRITDALADLPRLLRDIPTSGPLAIAQPEERRATTSAAPSPSPAFDEADAFDRWLADLTDRLAARLGTTCPSGRRLDFAAAHPVPLLSGPDAQADGEAIMSWHERLKRIVGADLKSRLPGTCRACDARGQLRHRNAEHLVKCRACHAVYEWDDYQDNLAPGEQWERSA